MLLETMLEAQRALQKEMNCMNTLFGEPKENILALVSETMEVLNELNWKPWKKPNAVNRTRLVKELVDVLMIYCNLLNSLEVNADELELMYAVKLAEVYKRIQDERA